MRSRPENIEMLKVVRHEASFQDGFSNTQKNMKLPLLTNNLQQNFSDKSKMTQSVKKAEFETDMPINSSIGKKVMKFTGKKKKSIE